MDERFKARFCGLPPARIVVSNPAGCMNVCLLRMFCVVRYRSMRRADAPFRGFLPSVACCCM
jgi:hypothetical protein